MPLLLIPQSTRICVTHLRTLFISYHYLGERYVLRVSCDVSPHGNHLSTIQWGHDELDSMILSSILCLLADLFSLPAFDRIVIRFIVQICFGVGGKTIACTLFYAVPSKSIKNECGCCDSLYMKLFYDFGVCWCVCGTSCCRSASFCTT